MRDEVDSGIRDRLGQALAEAWLASASVVVVDLTEGAFLSPSGGGVLARARAEATTAGGS